MDVSYKEFLNKVIDKLSWVSDELDFVYPYSTINGKYLKEKSDPLCWTNGFWGGILWYMYKYTKDVKYLELAKKCTVHFDTVLDKFDYISHDVGFQFLLTSVADNKITGDKRSMERALHAATILAGRFNPTGKYIKAWNDNPLFIEQGTSASGYAIIDCMMNIPLLFWASEVTGDPRFKQIAILHADTVLEHFIREDGTSNHIVVFDPDTGKVVKKPGGQGYSEGSSWTRGQAWAIYGFAMAYHYTKNQKYLESAKKTAKYFISHTKDYVPIDFAQPETPKYQDTSAAAICACGLHEILKYSEQEKDFYTSAINTMMDILYKNCDFTRNNQSILQNCSEMYNQNARIHISLIYGEFYMLEALLRITGNDDALYY